MRELPRPTGFVPIALLGAVAALVTTANYPATADPKPRKWPGEEVIGKVLKRSKRQDAFARFVKNYNMLIGSQADRYRLQQVRFAQENPLKLPERTYGLTDAVHESFSASLEDPGAALRPIVRALDLEPREGKSGPLRRGLEGEAHLDQIQEVLEEACSDCGRAFEEIGEEEREFLIRQAPILTDQFLRHIYLENNDSNYDDNRRAVDLGGEVAIASLGAAVDTLGRLLDRRYLEGLRRDLRKIPSLKGEGPAGVEGSVHLFRETPLGPIIIGGKGRNEYTQPAAVIIDIGGNDVYDGAPATSRTPEMPISVIIDLDGDDTYRADAEGVGLGILGIGLLADLGGNDTYRAGRRSLGCGLYGAGLVIDAEGDDAYRGTEYTQGAAAFGIGALIDHDGKDEYRADLYAQGFGMPRGFGALWDGAGNDSYVCTGEHPSVYGDKGEYNGMCQGIGIGLRGMQRGGLAAGGIGALLDGGGDDRYRAGQFGLGCGYYFGWGIVRDRGGDDDYEGSRYGLATGAHYALGVVIDDRGDDDYVGRGVANQAGNWDLTISYLIDGGGDDSYKATGLCQGSATITSLAVLADASGSDTYVATGANVQGHGGHGQDAGRKTRSFGFLLDFGKGRDSYAFKEAKDSQPRRQKTSNLKVHKDKDGNELGLGFFVDSSKPLR